MPSPKRSGTAFPTSSLDVLACLAAGFNAIQRRGEQCAAKALVTMRVSTMTYATPPTPQNRSATVAVIALAAVAFTVVAPTAMARSKKPAPAKPPVQATAPAPLPDGAAAQKAAPSASAPLSETQAKKDTPLTKAPPPDQWSADEIAAAQMLCSTLIGGLVGDYRLLPPVRQGRCGDAQPVEVHSLGKSPAVIIDPPAILNCRMTATLAAWIDKTLQPIARDKLGQQVVRLHNATSYACRNRYNSPSEKLSEHALANAIDISTFQLQDGRVLEVEQLWGPTLRVLVAQAEAKAAKAVTSGGGSGWQASTQSASMAADPMASDPVPSAAPAKAAKTKGKSVVVKTGTEAPIDKRPEAHQGSSALKKALADKAQKLGVSVPPPRTPEAIFVHALHDASCTMFGTVLGPEANDAHKDHFHLDLAVRKGSSFCQ